MGPHLLMLYLNTLRDGPPDTQAYAAKVRTLVLSVQYGQLIAAAAALGLVTLTIIAALTRRR